MDVGYVPDSHGRALSVHAHNDILDILYRLYITESANHELGLGHLDETTANVVIGPFNRVLYFAEGDIVCKQLIGIDLDLVLLNKTSDARYLCHTRHGL